MESERIGFGPRAVAELIMDHPGLPVLKMGGDGCGTDLDDYVLELVSGWLGWWFLVDDTYFDDLDDAMDRCRELGIDTELHPVPNGRCIWIRMDYTDIGGHDALPTEAGFRGRA